MRKINFILFTFLAAMLFIPKTEALTESASFQMKQLAARGVYSWIRAINTELYDSSTTWLSHNLTITGLYDSNQARTSKNINVKLFRRDSVNDSEDSAVSAISSNILVPSSGTLSLNLANYFSEILLREPGYFEMMIRVGNFLNGEVHYISGTWTITG